MIIARTSFYRAMETPDKSFSKTKFLRYAGAVLFGLAVVWLGR